MAKRPRIGTALVALDLALALILGALAPSVASAVAVQGQRLECHRPPARAAAAEARTVLRETRDFPCVVVVDSPRVTLSSDADPRVDNIERIHVGRDGQGRYYTSTGRAQVAVWDAAGRYLATLGRPGLGPGEFASRWALTHVDRSGRVYVRDAGGRWTLFSSALTFTRTTAPSAMSYDPEHAAFLDDGLFLTSSPAAGPVPTIAQGPEYWFHLYDFAAEPATGEGVARRSSFGRIRASDRPVGRSWTFAERMISYSGGATFWAGPPVGVGRGYELELWEAGGDAPRRVIRRDVPWFPNGSDREPLIRGDGVPPVPLAQVTGLHDDGTGLLFVIVYVPNPRWSAPRGPRTPQQHREDYDTMHDVYIEVIDANASVVLASVGPMRPSHARAAYPVGYFSRSRDGLRFAESAEGHSLVQIGSVRLEGARE